MTDLVVKEAGANKSPQNYNHVSVVKQDFTYIEMEKIENLDIATSALLSGIQGASTADLTTLQAAVGSVEAAVAALQGASTLDFTTLQSAVGTVSSAVAALQGASTCDFTTLEAAVSALSTAIVLAAGTAVIGKVRLASAEGDELSDDTYNAVKTLESAPSSIVHGSTVVANAGTAVALAASADIREAIVTAKDTNTGYIYLGNSGVTSSNYIKRLVASEEFVLPIDNPDKVYLDCSVDGEGVVYGYLK